MARRINEKKKKDVLNALEKTLGVVTSACRQVGISRELFYQWMRSDEEFKKQVDSINEIAIDFAETELFKQIKEGNPTATIFYLKTKAKHRGYIERQENILSVNPFLEAMKHVEDNDVDN